MVNVAAVEYCEIHPTLGIARVGNSPDEFYVGPEAPGVPAAPGRYKDDAGRVKRQAARFRLYAFAGDGTPLGEITAADAAVTWSVELANEKAAWHEFRSRFESDRPLRNKDVEGPARAGLSIRPGPRSVTGPNAAGAQFDTGTFLGTPVPLGELRTDEAGRLLVLGGYGHSASARPDEPIRDYANNDWWHDDVSDGPVTAKVVLGADGRTVPVTGAWVVVGPPDFAPEIDNVVTLYDVAREVAERQGWLAPPADVSFARDIYPVLERLSRYQWVNAQAVRGHGQHEPGDFMAPERLAALASNAAADAPLRQAVFARLRTPLVEDPAQASYTFMPQLAGDDGDPVEGLPRTWLTLLPGQYERFRRWAAGDFTGGFDGPPAAVPLDRLPVAEQPHALVRAALEPCVGGPFYPGIEMTYIANDPDWWQGAFRLRKDLVAGDVSKWMATPWQADFYECNTHWWPAQRPDDVLAEPEYLTLVRAAGAKPDLDVDESPMRVEWARGVGDAAEHYPEGDNEMVTKWSLLGFVVPRPDPARPERTVYVESERAPMVGLSDREWFYMLQHPDRFPRQAAAARDYTLGVLAHARAVMVDPDTPESLHPFRYTPEALQARLQQVYLDLAQQNAAYDPALDPTFKNRDAVVERIRQMAPFNLLDGAWLRGVTPAGPISEVHALLFSIWSDEVGNGDPSLNHSNLYADLLHEVGLYLPPVGSLEFSQLPEMLNSAYTVPAFELAISQHSEEFLPELLGMSLQLEWEVLGIRPTELLLEYYGIDAQFYAMHIGIDNAASGHGAKARDAIMAMLDEALAAGGDEAVQALWERIWTGYVAFAVTGKLGEELRKLVLQPPSPQERMVALVEEKAPFAMYNHNDRQLGANYLNDWFLDPPGLLEELVKSGLIIPGNPEQSPFFELTTYSGPMYKVFDDDELALWQEWTRWLEQHPAPQPVEPVEAMIAVIDTLRERQVGEGAHFGNVIAGPDPTDPTKIVQNPVAWWFGQPSVALLRAIAHLPNGLVVPGRPHDSVFLNVLIAPANDMGAAFSDVIPHTGGLTGRQVVVNWITAGCPTPPAGAPKRRVMLSSPMLAAPAEPELATVHVRPRVRGMGAVH